MCARLDVEHDLRASRPASALFSVCFARMSSACTSGRPALIIVENCRVKMTMSRILIDPPLGFFVRDLFVDLDDVQPLAPQLRDDLVARRRVDRRGLELAVERARGVV